MADKITARCMKCKAQKPMQKPKQSTNQRGTNMLKGECGDCGTKMCRIVGKGFKL
jgi:hypothetical protein